jgi:hypothetical protein
MDVAYTALLARQGSPSTLEVGSALQAPLQGVAAATCYSDMVKAQSEGKVLQEENTALKVQLASSSMKCEMLSIEVGELKVKNDQLNREMLEEMRDQRRIRKKEEERQDRLAAFVAQPVLPSFLPTPQSSPVGLVCSMCSCIHLPGQLICLEAV